MAYEWASVSLDELYEFSSGLSKPRSDFGSGYPFLSFKNVFYNSAVPQLTELVNSTEQDRLRCSVNRGDVFLTRTSETMDELGMSSVALADIPNATFNGFSKRLRPKHERRVMPEFARYYFRSPEFRRSVTAMSSMSTRASLNNEMLARIKIMLPPLEEQRAIAETLGALDDRIDNLRQTNATLQAIAAALFKSWFVDFDGVPPQDMQESELGLIPKGWRVSTVGAVCEAIFSGGTPDTRKPEYWNGELRWFSSGETRERIIIETEKRITQAGVNGSSTRAARPGDILIAAAGQGHTRGQSSFCAIDTYINQSVVCARADTTKCHPAWLYYNLQRRYEEIRRLSDSHSSRGSFTTKLLASMPLILPPIDAIQAFSSVAEALLASQAKNKQLAVTLATLRDTLLPSLISGQLKVKL